MEPCPFCGNKKIFIGTIEQIDGAAHVESSDYNDRHYKVVCDFSNGGCGASTGGQHETIESAKKAWEMRM